jgi:glycosyltransferase involved in cell wall biosynthesis
LLVGTGPDRCRTEKLVADLGVQDAVIFAGFVPDEELSEYYNVCDLFAMPSKGEGFGIVYLEALACGKPVLAGNKDGSRDALDDGELGLLVDPDNAAEIASETIRVLRRQHSHPNLFRPEFLRQRVVELFGFETFKRRLANQLRPFLREDRWALLSSDP